MLYGEELNDAIRRLVSEGDVSCAVAFWGSGASGIFLEPEGRNIRIICNLASGGTNPFEVEKLIKLLGNGSVRQMDNLHAKVYIGEDGAIVSSANASANGLGLEGQEQRQWLEAGLFADDASDAQRWFDGLFDSDDTRSISKEDINDAKDLWVTRRKVRPGLGSFRDFEISSEFPIISWISVYKKQDIDILKEEVRAQVGGWSPHVEQRIHNGIEILHRDEASYFDGGRWVLAYYLKDEKRRGYEEDDFLWVHAKGFVEDCYFYNKKEDNEDSEYSCVMKSEDDISEPFPIDSDFCSCFTKLINSDVYKALREEGTNGTPWINPRYKMMKRFWQDLSDLYRKQSKK